jgi:hydrogenase maturation factor
MAAGYSVEEAGEIEQEAIAEALAEAGRLGDAVLVIHEGRAIPVKADHCNRQEMEDLQRLAEAHRPQLAGVERFWREVAALPHLQRVEFEAWRRLLRLPDTDRPVWLSPAPPESEITAAAARLAGKTLPQAAEL